jgi:hypothetical protein
MAMTCRGRAVRRRTGLAAAVLLLVSVGVAIPGIAAAAQPVRATAAAASAASGADTVPITVTAYDNTGISPDSDQSCGDFDGGGYSYSASALASTGLTPDATVTADGLTFTWPNVAACSPDNILAAGQTIPVQGHSGATTLGLLGAASNGPSDGTITINYTDGTSSTQTVTFNDWHKGGPSGADTAVATMSYRNSDSGTSQPLAMYVYATAVPVDSSKTVASITFPDVSNSVGSGVTAMHVFAVSLGDTNNIPAQFIAKLYTEGLGRAPDQPAWLADTHFFQARGCTVQTLAALGERIYDSPEFRSDYADSDSAARVLALYRGALSRDPDQGEFDHYVDQLNSGVSWRHVVNKIFASAEFSNLVSAACDSASPDYGFGSQTPPTLPVGGKGYSGSEADLQTALDTAAAGSTVYLAQMALIHLTASLTIPGGVTLTTYGSPGPTRYALMGRLARASSFSGPLVKMESGSKLTDVWVDGQRNVLGYFKPGGGTSDNANIVTFGGTGTVVSEDKLSNPQGGTNFYSAGAGDGYPCAHETVSGNLVTAYGAAYGTADGLTMRCEGLDIKNNDIVDVADIGIVLFASPGVPQASTIRDNTIVEAGNTANAPISADPTTGDTGLTSTLNYSNTTFENNTFWTGPYTSFVFGIVAGAREWFTTAEDTDGTGASYINNTTGMLTARVRAGIAVAGMLNVTIKNDRQHPLSFILAQGTEGVKCPAANVIAEVVEGNASGAIPAPYYDSNFDDCIR